MMLIGPRRMLAHVTYATGSWRALSSGPTILSYHGIIERTRDSLLETDSLLFASLREQLDFFQKHRSVISLDQLIDEIEAGRPIDPRAIVLTFDDALASVATYAVPELTRRRMPFTVGVPAGIPGTRRTIWEYEAACLVHVAQMRHLTAELEHRVQEEMACVGCDASDDRNLVSRLKHFLRAGVSSDERIAMLDRVIEAVVPDLHEWIEADGRRRIMDWSELCAVVAAGGTLAAHGYMHHPHNGTLTGADRDRELRLPMSEIAGRAGVSCDCFIWPEGAVDPTSLARARDVGYRGLLTSQSGVVDERTSALDLPRVSGQWPLAQLLWNVGRIA